MWQDSGFHPSEHARGAEGVEPMRSAGRGAGPRPSMRTVGSPRAIVPADVRAVPAGVDFRAATGG